MHHIISKFSFSLVISFFWKMIALNSLANVKNLGPRLIFPKTPVEQRENWILRSSHNLNKNISMSNDEIFLFWQKLKVSFALISLAQIQKLCLLMTNFTKVK